MIVDNCWRCKGTAKLFAAPLTPFEVEADEPARWQVRCLGQCGAVGQSSTAPRLAVTLWNDAQREERRILTDTELLGGPGTDKLREDTP